VQAVRNPFPVWLDQFGALVDAGRVYFGESGEDPEVHPISVFWNPDLTIPAAQPLRTRAGILNNNGSPALAYVAEADYSVRLRDADGAEIFYLSSASESAGVSYQPLDPDLTAIAALATTPFGRSLLTTGDGAALRTLAGLANLLPSTGGTVTGNITRAGAGPLLYHASGFGSGRVFVTAAGAPDPTTADGDIWIEYA
jgi:hypothetical protein